jgi:hypothetical protein
MEQNTEPILADWELEYADIDNDKHINVNNVNNTNDDILGLQAAHAIRPKNIFDKLNDMVRILLPVFTNKRFMNYKLSIAGRLPDDIFKYKQMVNNHMNYSSDFNIQLFNMKLYDIFLKLLLYQNKGESQERNKERCLLLEKKATMESVINKQTNSNFDIDKCIQALNHILDQLKTLDSENLSDITVCARCAKSALSLLINSQQLDHKNHFINELRTRLNISTKTKTTHSSDYQYYNNSNVQHLPYELNLLEVPAINVIVSNAQPKPKINPLAYVIPDKFGFMKSRLYDIEVKVENIYNQIYSSEHPDRLITTLSNIIEDIKQIKSTDNNINTLKQLLINKIMYIIIDVNIDTIIHNLKSRDTSLKVYTKMDNNVDYLYNTLNSLPTSNLSSEIQALITAKINRAIDKFVVQFPELNIRAVSTYAFTKWNDVAPVVNHTQTSYVGISRLPKQDLKEIQMEKAKERQKRKLKRRVEQDDLIDEEEEEEDRGCEDYVDSDQEDSDDLYESLDVEY